MVVVASSIPHHSEPEYFAYIFRAENSLKVLDKQDPSTVGKLVVIIMS